MPYEKGNKWKGNQSGRPKGSENKVNTDLKNIILQLLEKKSSHLEEWMDRTAQTDPAKAIELYAKLSEFIIPKIRNNNISVEEVKERRVGSVKVQHVYQSPNERSLTNLNQWVPLNIEQKSIQKKELVG